MNEADFDFEYLKGTTLVRAEYLEAPGYEYSDRIEFELIDGSVVILGHHQDCCEGVYVEDITGNLSDLVGHPILRAEEVTCDDDEPVPEGLVAPEVYGGDYRWTFYKLDTIKGGVTIRWLGESNGYYSIDVDCWICPPNRKED